MTFTPPQLSEEDQHGIHMPDYLKCDACMAISYTVHSAFEKKHNAKKDKTWKMDEGQIMEIFGNSRASANLEIQYISEVISYIQDF